MLIIKNTPLGVLMMRRKDNITAVAPGLSVAVLRRLGGTRHKLPVTFSPSLLVTEHLCYVDGDAVTLGCIHHSVYVTASRLLPLSPQHQSSL